MPASTRSLLVALVCTRCKDLRKKTKRARGKLLHNRTQATITQ